MFDSLQRFFGAAFYQKPQEYTVVLGAKLTNRRAAPISAQLCLPIPVASGYQEIISAPAFSHAPIEKTEAKFGNRYALWPIELPARKSDIRRMTVTVKVHPVRYREREFARREAYRTMSVASIWLNADNYIEPQHPEIQKLAAKFQEPAIGVYDLIQKLNQYVGRTLKYGRPISGLYPTRAALASPQVDCGGFATFLTSLLRAVGIPARIALGFWAGYPNQKENMHAWLEAQLPSGQWLPIDPATETLREARRTRKYAALGFFGSDHVLFSYGAGMTIETGGQHYEIDILQNPIVFPETVRASIKLEKIFSATRR